MSRRRAPQGETRVSDQVVPRYSIGLWVTIGAQMFTIVLVALLSLFNTRFNKKLDEGREPPIQGIEGFRYSI